MGIPQKLGHQLRIAAPQLPHPDGPWGWGLSAERTLTSEPQLPVCLCASMMSLGVAWAGYYLGCLPPLLLSRQATVFIPQPSTGNQGLQGQREGFTKKEEVGVGSRAEKHSLVCCSLWHLLLLQSQFLQQAVPLP